MSNIESSIDTRNSHKTISVFFHKSGKRELYRLLDEGRVAIKDGRKRPLQDATADMKRRIADGAL